MKSKLIVMCLVFAASVQYIYGQNSEVRTLASFDKINVSGNAKVTVTPGSPQSVRVETEHKLADVKTVVEGGTLKIGGKPSSIYIIVPALSDVNISGYGSVQSDSAFGGQGAALSITGNGKIIMPVDVDSLSVNISGFGKMKLTGNAKSMKTDVSGNGAIDAHNLKTRNADVNISGVGKVLLDVTEELNMNVSGVGRVYYKSEPKKINRQVSGIGKFGQIDAKDDDTTTVHIGSKRIIIVGDDKKKMDEDDNNDIDIDIDIDEKQRQPKKPSKARSHWGGLDLGFNNFFTDGTSTALSAGNDYLELNTGKSIHVGINIFKHDIKIYKRYVLFTTGVGLTLNNYRFNTDKTLVADSVPIRAAIDLNDNGEQIEYNKNKLAVSYVTVPLLITFNTNEKLKKSFHLGAGMLFSYKYDSHLKLVYERNGDKQKTKRRDDFNIDPFRYDFTLRIGYRNYTLFGNYAMTELFKNGKGPTLHPFSVGLQVVGW